MRNQLRVLSLLCSAILCVAAGCGSQSSSNTGQRTKTVYIDTRSGKTVIAEPSEKLPAVNPNTGKRTLMPALYCPQCDTWYAAPPVEVQQRNPDSRRCPKHGTPLSTEGPVPKQAGE